MTANTTQQIKEQVSSCPVCNLRVHPDVYAVVRRGDWHHLRCAIEHDERERAALSGGTGP